MENYKERIFKSLSSIDQNCTRLTEELNILTKKVQALENENKHLKETTKSVISELDNYIVEMERIKQEYVDRNNNN